ncbi:glucose-1-phosphate cytidylyltransferase, partial [Candidatus Peregrinibacteria bacterium]|nr:glucose-1-phosphate cytidylyltransferase [Candidatus Peregrinibacteria bacterium]
MPVIIFCGGKGTRLKEETDFKPKPMVNVGGMPILWHIMKIYSTLGFNNFILCLGYKSEYIKDFFLRQKLRENDISLSLKSGQIDYLTNHSEDWNITFAETGEDALTGERLHKVAKYITHDRFMVTYGDGVGEIDLHQLLDFHEKQRTIGTITGVHPYSKWGLVDTDEKNLIQLFRQKPKLNEYVNGGFMVFEKAALGLLRENTIIEDMFDKLVAQKQLSLYRHEGFWHAMDTYQDVET